MISSTVEKVEMANKIRNAG